MEITRRLLFIVGFGFILGSALGAPSPQHIPSEKDPLVEVVDKMGKGVGIMETVTVKAGQYTDKINTILEALIQRIIELKSQIDGDNEKLIRHTNKSIKVYHEVTQLLRSIRNRLIRLSSKTVTATEELKIYMAGWEDQNKTNVKAYLEKQLQIIRELLEESKPILQEAEEKYGNAEKKMSEIEIELLAIQDKTIQGPLLQLVIEGLKNDPDIVAIKFGLDALDWLGCFGLCNINGRINEAVEPVKAKIEQLANAHSRIGSILKTLKSLSSFVKDEVVIIVEWSEQVVNMKKKVNSATSESFNQLPLHRDNFTAAVERLQAAAQAYRDKTSVHDRQGE